MKSSKDEIQNLKSLHFIGIGGIGMSGLAQFFKWLGYNVSGSDRALENPENKELIDKLKKQGIKFYAQDGSYAETEIPDILIYSTAVEEDNPDFVAGGNIQRWHRAEALEFLCEKLKKRSTIAISGSCGKTTVTSWLGETLLNLGLDPIVLSGGIVNKFNDDTYLGNFHPGDGEYFVFEADESDKSLVAFHPDFSVVLNIGTDHYPKEELIDIFENFLRNTKYGAAVEIEVFKLLDPDSYKHLRVKVFSTNDLCEKAWCLEAYSFVGSSAFTVFSNGKENFEVQLPVPGEYNAVNALSVFSTMELLKTKKKREKIIDAISVYSGVQRRFEFVGETNNKTFVYDDYAHNVEKICSIISAVQKIVKGNVYAVFQPHGYAPLKFMRNDLFPGLEKTLRNKDVFVFMQVYYAGGTSSFTPQSSDVCEEYSEESPIKNRYKFFRNRKDADEFLLLEPGKDDAIVIMGARDNSLSIWAKDLCRKS